MSEKHGAWTDRLSDYLAGELEAADLEAVEHHLGECGSCRRVLEELRGVIAQAGALPDLDPPRDLWAGIAATIRAPVDEVVTGATVIALPTRGADRAHGTDIRTANSVRIAFSLPQLAAASIALIAISAATTWVAGPGLGVDRAQDPALPPAGAVTLVSDVPGPSRGLSTELSALEETLVSAFATLDPNTVRVLERNLTVIEQAIADSRQALAQDPGNEFLTDHLDRGYQRKLTYLRDVARLVEWTG